MRQNIRLTSYKSEVLQLHRVLLNHEFMLMVLLHVQIQISENQGLGHHCQNLEGHFRNKPEVIRIFEEINGCNYSNIQKSKSYEYLLELLLFQRKLIFYLHEFFLLTKAFGSYPFVDVAHSSPQQPPTFAVYISSLDIPFS